MLQVGGDYQDLSGQYPSYDAQFPVLRQLSDLSGICCPGEMLWHLQD